MGPKLLLAATHASSIAAAAWILFGSNVISLFAGTLPFPDPQPGLIQRLVLLLCSVGYFLRLCIGAGVLLQRTIRWDEALGVGLLLFLLHPVLALLSRFSGAIPWTVLSIGVVLYCVGSFINTYSELQRHRWKQRHPGSLYTQGFFGWAMHINYFGDIVLFVGFAVVTGSLLALIIPIVTGAAFCVYHVPRLDRHLAKYGEPFREWEARTAKLVPFVY